MACTPKHDPNVGLRRRCGDCSFMRLPVDPAFGVPEAGSWMYLDQTTNYVRPFTSTTVVADVIASPIKGYCLDFIRPGEERIITIWTCGEFAFKLSTPAPVRAGITKFKPFFDGTKVSNTLFEVTALPAEVLITASEHRSCVCQSEYESNPCTTATAPIAASPTAAIVLSNATYAIGMFGGAF